jgi:nucleoside-diphosphate-sugar epimerase
MRIFVTGAAGWIGSAVIPELLEAGHDVVGLARSDSTAERVAGLGAEVQRGSLDDLDVLAGAAAASDGVIHLAFRHDLAFTGDFQGAAETDRRAIDTFGDSLAGSDRPFVIASGTLGIAPGRLVTEQDRGDSSARAHLGGGPAIRMENARVTIGLAERGVRSAVVRLPPTVHGDGDHGFVATIVGIARDTGVSATIGDGSNRWPAVHRFDAARLFRLAVESAPAGSVLHAVADEGVPTREIAGSIGRQLGLPLAEIAPADAPAHFSWLAGFFGLDSPASSAGTRELLGWEPTHPGLLEDLDAGFYTR